MNQSIKKKYIICGIVIVILLIIFVKCIYRDQLYQKIHSSKKDYSSFWILKQWNDDGMEANTIYIKFSLKLFLEDHDSDDLMNSIRNTYESLVYTFLEDSKSQYKDYNLKITFNDIDENFIIYVDGNDQSIDVINAYYSISIADIAAYFPQTESLTLVPARYESIEEIDGFTDLKEISFSQRMTKEEKEYIRSVFPDCYIDPSYYKDGAIYYDTEE